MHIAAVDRAVELIDKAAGLRAAADHIAASPASRGMLMYRAAAAVYRRAGAGFVKYALALRALGLMLPVAKISRCHIALHIDTVAANGAGCFVKLSAQVSIGIAARSVSGGVTAIGTGALVIEVVDVGIFKATVLYSSFTAYFATPQMSISTSISLPIRMRCCICYKVDITLICAVYILKNTIIIYSLFYPESITGRCIQIPQRRTSSGFMVPIAVR